MNEYSAKWQAANGDRTHRLNYDCLNPDSLVFDVGGYRGDWASDIFSKYNCHIWIFEPVKSFYDKIVKRFEKNEKIRVFNIGLSDTTKEATIFIDSDSSSTHRDVGAAEKIVLKSFAQFVEEEKVHVIHLMKLNIEGEEYPLLSKIVDDGMQTMIRNIQVQFHDWVEDKGRGRPYIHEGMWKHHHLTYNYPFIHENWEINEGELKPRTI